jgi:molecular chaperone DnaJ
VAGDRAALLIANGTYETSALRALRSPAHDTARLAEVLGHPDIGGFRVESLTDMPEHRIRKAVERFFHGRGRDDTLLLYLSCHGIKNDDGRLYFAARDTEKELLDSTALSAAFVQMLMDRCRARTVIVLLDCCYSGAFVRGFKGDDTVHVRDELLGHGRVVITATNHTEYAWEGEHAEPLVPQLSRFTAALVEGLRTGAADLDRDGLITPWDLYEYVYEEMRREGVRQTPRIFVDMEHKVVLAGVAARKAVHPPPRRLPEPEPRTERELEPRTEPERAPEPEPERGTDQVVHLDLTVEQMAFGTERSVTFATALRCTACGATGVTGPGSAACTACAGEGRVRGERTIALTVPAGIGKGARILHTGEGEAGPRGGAAGDLYLEVGELPDPRFTRTGDDLRVTERVAWQILRHGGLVSFRSLDGPVEVRVPAGHVSTRPLVVPGRGAHRWGGTGRGDLLVSLAPNYRGVQTSEKLRVYEVAKDLGVESKVVMARLQEMGEFVRSASSTLSPHAAQRVADDILAARPHRSGGTGPSR